MPADVPRPVVWWEMDWVDGYVWVRFEPVHRWWHWVFGPEVFFVKLTREQAHGLGLMLTKLTEEP